MNKECNTCMGYGLWAFGAPAPIGPMDAADGMPAKPCPECGACGVNKTPEDSKREFPQKENP